MKPKYIKHYKNPKKVRFYWKRMWMQKTYFSKGKIKMEWIKYKSTQGKFIELNKAAWWKQFDEIVVIDKPTYGEMF